MLKSHKIKKKEKKIKESTKQLFLNATKRSKKEEFEIKTCYKIGEDLSNPANLPSPLRLRSDQECIHPSPLVFEDLLLCYSTGYVTSSSMQRISG